MSANTTTPYINDPAFEEMLDTFQEGNWDQGFEKLDTLVEQYPSVTELRDFRQEMKVRARVDEYEREDKKKETLRKLAYWGSRAAVVLIIVGLLAWQVNTYSSWIVDRWSSLQQNVMQEVQTLDLAVKFRDAQNYLAAGRPEDALALSEEIAEQDPDYPGLADLQTDINQSIELEDEYQQALTLLESGDTLAALSEFQSIQDQRQGYKDVSQKIQEIENGLILNDLYSQAKAAYDEGTWEDAISLFESLRAVSPNFRSETVEEYLIDSYLNAATAALSGESQSQTALTTAENYFRKALVLRPMDPEILAAQDQALEAFKERLFLSYLEKARATLVDNEDSLAALETADSYYQLALNLKPNNEQVILERKLTRAFLNAQQNFLDRELDVVIEDLEFVFENDEDYANGTARQTLYDAYMERGRRSITYGEYEAAISDFQRAAVIAEDTPQAIVHVYWSLIEMADTYGLLAEYQQADSLYKHAVEWISLRELLQDEHQDLVVLLDEADRYAGLEWYRTAYRLYNLVLPAEEMIYSALYHDVEEGEYLTQLATKYNTTVEAILDANEIADPAEIRAGQRIVIPILQRDEE